MFDNQSELVNRMDFDRCSHPQLLSENIWVRLGIRLWNWPRELSTLMCKQDMPEDKLLYLMVHFEFRG